MRDTPRCNALESNPLDSFDYRAWMTLARELERELDMMRDHWKKELLRNGSGDVDSEALSALRNLVSCVERDQGKGGILLPTEAALMKAKEVLRDNS